VIYPRTGKIIKNIIMFLKKEQTLLLGILIVANCQESHSCKMKMKNFENHLIVKMIPVVFFLNAIFPP